MVLFIRVQFTFAHAELLSSSPQQGQELTSPPKAISAQFSETLAPGLIQMDLYNEKAEKIPLLPPKISPGKPEQMEVSVPTLPQGTYSVVWQVVSADGHTVKGIFSFSVGRGGTPVKSPVLTQGQGGESILLAFRFLAESTLIIGFGFSLVLFMARRKGIFFIPSLSKRVTVSFFLFLIFGMMGEGIAYLFTLPTGTISNLFQLGKADWIWQTPFLLMVFSQLILLLALVFLSRQEWLKLFLLFLLVVLQGTGGHAWGISPVWLSLSLRMIHLLSLSIWLGCLGSFFSYTWQRKRGELEFESESGFRPFFLSLVLKSALATLVSGIFLLFLQVDVLGLIAGITGWGLLFFTKMILIGMMLLLALKQTLSWRKRNQVTPLLSGMEGGIGILVLLLGIWMSQSAYPIQQKGVVATLVNSDGKVEIQLSPLSVGKQKGQIAFLSGQNPRQVSVIFVTKDVQLQPISAQKVGKGQYQFPYTLPMAGTWTMIVDAEYSDLSHHEWVEDVTITGGGTSP